MSVFDWVAAIMLGLIVTAWVVGWIAFAVIRDSGRRKPGEWTPKAYE